MKSIRQDVSGSAYHDGVMCLIEQVSMQFERHYVTLCKCRIVNLSRDLYGEDGVRNRAGAIFPSGHEDLVSKCAVVTQGVVGTTIFTADRILEKLDGQFLVDILADDMAQEEWTPVPVDKANSDLRKFGLIVGRKRCGQAVSECKIGLPLLMFQLSIENGNGCCCCGGGSPSAQGCNPFPDTFAFGSDTRDVLKARQSEHAKHDDCEQDRDYPSDGMGKFVVSFWPCHACPDAFRKFEHSRVRQRLQRVLA
jgi:hypothetical protein